MRLLWLARLASAVRELLGASAPVASVDSPTGRTPPSPMGPHQWRRIACRNAERLSMTMSTPIVAQKKTKTPMTIASGEFMRTCDRM